MSDAVTFTRDGKTYTVTGLEEKRQSIANASFELDMMLGGRVGAAKNAQIGFHGKHACLWAERVNPVLSKLADIKVDMWKAQNIIASFPEPFVAHPRSATGAYPEEVAAGAKVEVPALSTSSGAETQRLRSYGTNASGGDQRIAGLAGAVNLTGVKVTMTSQRPLTAAEHQAAVASGEHPADLNGATVPETAEVNPTTLIVLPTPVERVRGLTDESSRLIEWTLAVATAFETGDSGMLDRLAANPDALRDRLTQLRQDPTLWNRLSEAEKRVLIESLPAEIGAMNGLPIVVRDEANRIVMQRAKDVLVARRHELKRQLQDYKPLPGMKGAHPDMTARSDELELVEQKLRGIGVIEERLKYSVDGRKAYLVGFDPSGRGKAIVAINNPDEANTIVTFVPGTGARLGHVGADLGRAEAMAADAGPGTSTILWIGYDSPTGADAASSSKAREAAQALRDFQDGLDTSHVGGPAPRKVVVGHSYGTTVIGYAASGGKTLNADAAIFVGSPGVGVDRASDLSLKGQPAADWVWSSTGDSDRAIGESAWHGTDPDDPEFGGQAFGSSRDTAHSDYWDDGNEARRNMAAIIAGRYDQITQMAPMLKTDDEMWVKHPPPPTR